MSGDLPPTISDHVAWVQAAWPSGRRRKLVLGGCWIGISAMLWLVTMLVAPETYRCSAVFRLTDYGAATPITSAKDSPVWGALIRSWGAEQLPIARSSLSQNKREGIAVLQVMALTPAEAVADLERSIAYLTQRYADLSRHGASVGPGLEPGTPILLSRSGARSLAPTVRQRLVLVLAMGLFITVVVALTLARAEER